MSWAGICQSMCRTKQWLDRAAWDNKWHTRYSSSTRSLLPEFTSQVATTLSDHLNCASNCHAFIPPGDTASLFIKAQGQKSNGKGTRRGAALREEKNEFNHLTKGTINSLFRIAFARRQPCSFDGFAGINKSTQLIQSSCLQE